MLQKDVIQTDGHLNGEEHNKNNIRIMIKNNTSKVLKEVTPLSNRDCLYIADRSKSEFTYPVHAHKECELNFTEHATGVRRVVGDSSEILGEYDLVLIGGGVEHVWEQNECRCDKIREITIHFSSDMFLNSFKDKAPFDSIKELLAKAQNGVEFPMQAILKVYDKLDSLCNQERPSFYAFTSFMEILYELSLYKDVKTLSTTAKAKIELHPDNRKIKIVKEFINKNYKEEIRLSDLAGMVGMSSVAFSRLFKNKTGRSLSDYIIDIRLGYASRMLIDSQIPVADICFHSGFNNLSNFNRIFKKKKNCSPKEFRDTYRKKKIIV